MLRFVYLFVGRRSNYRTCRNIRQIGLILLIVALISLATIIIWINERGGQRACSDRKQQDSEEVKEFWEKHTKKLLEKRPDAPLHQFDFYQFPEVSQWDEFVRAYITPLGIRDGDSVFESGSGSGAFLDSLTRMYKNITIAGVDRTPLLIQIANTRLKGKFFVGDVTDLSVVPDKSYDQTIAFGVVVYLPSEQEAKKAVEEMIRITKPGGGIYIGNTNDAAKESIAPCFSSSLFLHKNFWYNLASEHPDVEKIEIIDEYKLKHFDLDLNTFTFPYDTQARFRYSVYMWKKAT